MKRQWFRLFSVAGLLSVLALLCGPSGAVAQEGQGKFVTEAALRLTKLVHAANKEKFSLADNTLSIGGGWLKQSKTDWTSSLAVKLEKGKTYRFIAAGDEDAKDVDLEVRDGSGKVVATDTKTDPEAIVDFTPGESGTYSVRIRLYDSENGLPCACLAIMMTKD